MSGYHERNWQTFPMDTIKRVDRPTTTIIDDQVKRVDERESGFCKAARGDYGPRMQKERMRFVPKHPVSGALMWMTVHMKDVVDGIVAAEMAEIQDTMRPEGPAHLVEAPAPGTNSATGAAPLC